MSEDPRKNLLRYLLNNTRASSSLRSFVPGRIEIASFIITIILFVLIGIVGYFGLGERYAIGIAHLIGVTLLTPMIVTIIRDAKIIRSPTRMLIESSILKMDDQDSLIERFPSKDIDDLNRIKDHLEFEVNGLIARTSVIAGSIGRLGPVQAMFLIYTSYYLKLFNIS